MARVLLLCAYSSRILGGFWTSGTENADKGSGKPSVQEKPSSDEDNQVNDAISKRAQSRAAQRLSKALV